MNGWGTGAVWEIDVDLGAEINRTLWQWGYTYPEGDVQPRGFMSVCNLQMRLGWMQEYLKTADRVMFVDGKPRLFHGFMCSTPYQLWTYIHDLFVYHLTPVVGNARMLIGELYNPYCNNVREEYQRGICRPMTICRWGEWYRRMLSHFPHYLDEVYLEALW